LEIAGSLGFLGGVYVRLYLGWCGSGQKPKNAGGSHNQVF
jgi:hypothetical protein